MAKGVSTLCHVQLVKAWGAPTLSVHLGAREGPLQGAWRSAAHDAGLALHQSR